MKYVFLGVSNAFFFVVGLWVGGILCGLHPLKPVEIVYPSPVVYWEGKRSEPGVLSPEMEHRIELQTIFNGETSQAVKDGPLGLDAPWKVKR